MYTLLSLMVLLCCAGCTKHMPHHKHNIKQEVDIPVADESYCFDADINEFAATELDVHDVASIDMHDYDAFTQDALNEDNFKTICFDFDSHDIAPDQQEALAHNIELAKAYITDNAEYEPTIIIEAHVCHSTGQPWYNTLISEQRAQMVADELIKAGVPQECLKIVCHDSEMTTLSDDHEANGDSVVQAPNRHCEIKLIYA